MSVVPMRQIGIRQRWRKSAVIGWKWNEVKAKEVIAMDIESALAVDMNGEICSYIE